MVKPSPSWSCRTGPGALVSWRQSVGVQQRCLSGRQKWYLKPLRPSGQGGLPEWKTPFEEIQIGKGRKIKDGQDIAILSLGHPGNFATMAIRELKIDGLNPAHYDMRFVKPLDEELILRLAAGTHRVVTVEDHMVAGGFGSAVLELLESHGLLQTVEIRLVGFPDRLIEHGAPSILKELYGLTSSHIKDVVWELVEAEAKGYELAH